MKNHAKGPDRKRAPGAVPRVARSPGDSPANNDRVFSLDEVVTAFDEHGNHYRRKIRTGLRRGELYLERSKDGVPIVYQKADTTEIRVHNFNTGKDEMVKIKDPGDDIRICWYLTEEAYTEGERDEVMRKDGRQ